MGQAQATEAGGQTAPTAPTSSKAAKPAAAAAASTSASTSSSSASTTTAPSDLPAAADGSNSPLPFVPTPGEPGVGEKHLDLWYTLVEWVSTSLETGIVLAWDSEEVGHRILALASNQQFIESLREKAIERRKKRIAALKAKQQEQLKQAAGRQAQVEKETAISAGADPDTFDAPPLELLVIGGNNEESQDSDATSGSSATASAAPALAAPPADIPVYSDPIPFHLASTLLSIDRPLAQLRHSLVPAKVNEDTFWELYFAALLRTVREHVLSLQQPEEQLQTTNPHAEEFFEQQRLKLEQALQEQPNLLS